jgi:enamine deaminase RidA (YjgF/YER057c/UK114 family)
MKLWPDTSSPEWAGSVRSLHDKTLSLLSKYVALGKLFCLQTILATRNLQRVLSTLRSSIHLTVTCVVYINTAACAVLDEAIVCALVGELLLLDWKVSSAYEECDDTHEDRANQPPPPILVVGVRDLPRHAMVELEVVALTDKIPQSALETDTIDLNHRELSDRSVEENPFTADPLDGYIILRSACGIMAASDDEDISCDIQGTMFAGCFLFSASSLTYRSTSKEMSRSINLEIGLRMLFISLRRLLRRANLHPRFIISIRLYFAESVTDIGNFHLLAGSLSAYCLGIPNIPLILIPFVSQADTDIKCLASCINMDQLATELWIRDANR